MIKHGHIIDKTNRARTCATFEKLIYQRNYVFDIFCRHLTWSLKLLQ